MAQSTPGRGAYKLIFWAVATLTAVPFAKVEGVSKTEDAGYPSTRKN